MVEKCKDVTEGYTTKNKCEKWPKQVCTLTKKTVKRYTPNTQCRQVPKEICGPGPCPIVAGPDECREEVKTIVQEIPDETCTLNPQKICTRKKRNPRKVKRPVVKKWCYTPKIENDEIVVEETIEEKSLRSLDSSIKKSSANNQES
ncbi:unnamed protein product [Lepeophtheirus salmonis]|uniref:(salmon louse) hypothetical protein n=1 Tax=Lepeophtheirus salmonis TaxID=72036 RepID=A0A7R8H629_LEPSM|nr:unnamed protein product [Lepeophtheirus salmonis]CAF2894067.1 unnamed protein product [Lepeophtheirus salmonis]